jgi:DNA-binding GntR family transcriptional regulator
MSNKIIVMCAVAGSAETYWTNPAVPITLEQIVTAALAAGADAELVWQAVIDIKCHMDRVCHLTLLDQKTVLGLIDQHETILAAIDAQAADAADRAMRHRLTEVLRSLPKVRADRADLFE